MKIKTIEINNYKAFYGEQKINVGGKNMFIYGENGIGKRKTSDHLTGVK